LYQNATTRVGTSVAATSTERSRHQSLSTECSSTRPSRSVSTPPGRGGTPPPIDALARMLPQRRRHDAGARADLEHPLATLRAGVTHQRVRGCGEVGIVGCRIVQPSGQ
jgi:hypothetical protein